MTDKHIINASTLALYCNTNEAVLTSPVRGFVLEFPGLGGGSCMGGCMDFGEYCGGYAGELGREGILVAYTFPGPWSWMNPGAVRYCELLAQAIREKYALPRDIPWVVTGGSMGGLGALIFSADAKEKPHACLAVCPCVDVLSCYEIRPDFRRTMIGAALCGSDSIEEGLRRLSPVLRMEDMPFIPYLLINDCDDDIIPAAQMDAYVAEMQKLGHRVDYDRLEHCGHGAITPEAWAHILGFFRKHLKLS